MEKAEYLLKSSPGRPLQIVLLMTYRYQTSASKDTSSLMAQVKGAKPFIFGAIEILFLTTPGLATRCYAVSGLDTDLKTTYAICLRGREMTADKRFI